MIRLSRKLQRQTDDLNCKTVTLSLSIDQRMRSRQRLLLDNGTEASLFLERGTLLRGGDLLSDADQTILVEVLAADETVSTVYCDNPLQLAKAAYHLGNRHIPLQIAKNWLRYQHDHVLDDMLRLMHLQVTVEQAPFEPEAGAYRQQGTHGHHD